MGFFDFLFGSRLPKNVTMHPDKLWITPEAKWAGLRNELDERAKTQSMAILLVAYFEDTFAALNELAQQYTGSTPLTVALAENLTPEMAARLPLDASGQLELIVAERHLLWSADEQLLQFAAQLPCRCRLVHHLSLEDPVLKVFVGSNFKEMLSRLGMTESESIESQMVSRRVRAAQKKIEAGVPSPQPASTAAEWIAKNMPHVN